MSVCQARGTGTDTQGNQGRAAKRSHCYAGDSSRRRKSHSDTADCTWKGSGRVAIARALVSDAPIILADEPTGNLDSVTAGEIINILKTLAKERNKCVIVVTHSKEAADSADIILELSGKKLKKVK